MNSNTFGPNASTRPCNQEIPLSDREFVINLVNKLPENTPLEAIVREIEFVAGVKQAIAASDRGDVVLVDEARRLIKQWTSKAL